MSEKTIWQNITDDFQNNKEIFKNLIKKYLGYRSEWNIDKILNFIKGLDVLNFNKIFKYFEEQRDRTKNVEIKMNLITLGSIILKNRNIYINDSKDKLYETNMTVVKWWIINSNWKSVDKNNKVKSLETGIVERLLNWIWYSILLNFWDWEPHTFHIKTSDNSIVVMDNFNNPLKCNVEFMWMDIKNENIWLWQERVINIKEYRVLIWNLFFVLKFND